MSIHLFIKNRVKHLFLVMAGFVLLSLASCSNTAHEEIAATQKTLASSHLPPLIPLKAITKTYPKKWGFQLSDTGKWLAWRTKQNKKIVLRYRLTAGGKVHELSPKGAFFSEFDDLRKALYIRNNSSIWRVDPQNPSKKWHRIIPRGLKKWRVIAHPQTNNPYWYFISVNKSSITPDFYRYDPDGKHRKRMLKNDGSTLSVIFSPKGKLAFRYRRLKNGNTAIETPNAQHWKQLFEIKAKDTFTLAAIPKPGKTIWALSNRGRDKLAAVSINPKTGKESVFYQNKQVDVSVFHIDPKTNRPRDVQFYNPSFAAVGFTKKYRKLYQLINPQQEKVFTLVSKTADHNQVIVASSDKEGGYRYFLIDAKAGTRQPIGEGPLAPYAKSLSKTQPVTIKARDGLMLPALLTLPKGANKGPLPLVLRVHGGPSLRDFWGYHSGVNQFLANRGYAVLRVNFRGSTGYGRQFQAAGFGQIGEKMQDDLDDAVKWVIAKGIADPGHIAIMGASYGGYAALTAAWRGHGLYKAAIADAAVSDMAFQTEDYPMFWKTGLHRWIQYTGDPKDPKIRQHLRDISPINHAKAFTIPLLLVQGTKDNVVDVQQAQLLQRALEQNHKTVKTIYLDGEHHGVTTPKNWMTYLRAAEIFLAQHIGGRSEKKMTNKKIKDREQ